MINVETGIMNTNLYISDDLYQSIYPKKDN